MFGDKEHHKVVKHFRFYFFHFFIFFYFFFVSVSEILADETGEDSSADVDSDDSDVQAEVRKNLERFRWFPSLKYAEKGKPFSLKGFFYLKEGEEIVGAARVLP